MYLCDACNRHYVYLKNPDTGKMVPCDLGGYKPGDEEFIKGAHVSHFTTCDDPKWFRENRQRYVEPGEKTDA